MDNMQEGIAHEVDARRKQLQVRTVSPSVQCSRQLQYVNCEVYLHVCLCTCTSLSTKCPCTNDAVR